MNHATPCHAIPFDTLAFAKKLETAGIPPAHAEAQAKALSDALQQVEESRLRELATKGDVLRLEHEMASTKVEIIKWTAGMFIAQSALIIGALFAMFKMNQSPFQPGVHPAPTIQEMRQPAPQTPQAPVLSPTLSPIPSPTPSPTR
ncbi:MAG: CCDC90 family protein [Magnetococcus sp. DMHC-1]